METKPNKKNFFEKFKEGKLFDFLKKSGSNILDIAGDITGIEALSKLGDLIDTDKTLSPEDKLKAKELLELDLKELQMILDDKASARNMQVEALRQTNNFAKNYIYFLSSFIILAAVAFGLFLCFVEIPQANRRLVEMFADIFLFAGAITVIQFFFGSSKGSKDKTEIFGK